MKDMDELDSDVETYGLIVTDEDRLDYVENKLAVLEDLLKNLCNSKIHHNQFKDNTYKNCHLAKEGAIFHLTNGAKVNLYGTKTLADNNSAYKGGFAYVGGTSTRLTVNQQLMHLKG